MYISDTDNSRKWFQTARIYLLFSLSIASFGAIYELFSHEVYSYYMLYAFMFPLAGGTLPFLCWGISTRNPPIHKECCTLYHCGIVTLTVGSIVKGILEIYGTTNILTLCYWITGFTLVIIAFVLRPARTSEIDFPK